MDTFSERLRKKRKEKGLTQAEMAERIGLKQTGYAEIEQGKSTKKFYQLYRIARELGCSIDDLFPEKDIEEENEGWEP